MGVSSSCFRGTRLFGTHLADLYADWPPRRALTFTFIEVESPMLRFLLLAVCFSLTLREAHGWLPPLLTWRWEWWRQEWLFNGAVVLCALPTGYIWGRSNKDSLGRVSASLTFICGRLSTPLP